MTLGVVQTTTLNLQNLQIGDSVIIVVRPAYKIISAFVCPSWNPDLKDRNGVDYGVAGVSCTTAIGSTNYRLALVQCGGTLPSVAIHRKCKIGL